MFSVGFLWRGTQPISNIYQISLALARVSSNNRYYSKITHALQLKWKWNGSDANGWCWGEKKNGVTERNGKELLLQMQCNVQLWNNLGNESQRALEYRNKSEENYVCSVNKQILVNNMEADISTVQSRSNSKQWIYEAHLVIVDLFSSVRIVQFLTLACTQHTCTAQTCMHRNTHEQRVSKSITLCVSPSRVQSLTYLMKRTAYIHERFTEQTQVVCEWWKKTTTFQFPAPLWRQEVKIEINHLENLRPSHRTFGAAIFKFIYMPHGTETGSHTRSHW